MNTNSPSIADLMRGPVAEPQQEPNLQEEIIKNQQGGAEPPAPGDPDPNAPPAPAAEPPAPGEEPPAPEEPEGEEHEELQLSADEFYNTLDGMYGEDINSQVDYGQTDPMSPEGVFIREQYIRDRAQMEFAESLKQNDPRAYGYFLHRSSGGSDEEFFSQKSFVLPDLQALKDDVDLQRDLYQQVLLNRGNSQKQADALVKMAIDSGELLSEAEAAYKVVQENEARVAREAEEANQRAKAKQQEDVNVIGNAINETISSNNALRFIIPQAEKEQFSEEFRKCVHYENGQFFLVKPLDKNNLNQLMEAELFAYLKGDVSKLVQKQATTVAAHRTIKRIKTQETVRSTNTPEPGKALRDIIN